MIRAQLLVSLVTLVTVVVPAMAQDARLGGTVISAADRAPIADVHVRELSAAGVGRQTITSASGSFALTLANTPTRIVATRIGFAPETLSVAGPAPVVIEMRAAPLTLTPTIVAADRGFSAASSAVVRELDIRLRPRESSQDLLRLAPGLVIAQHAGGGKAEQLYLRGFDADHGTDVAVSVDGIPVNMVTHAHGQGYADLHWMMPEVVEGADVRKGPFDVRDGDFATAGAVAFRTKDRIGTHASMEARAGSFDTRHVIGLLPLGGNAGSAGGYLAASTHYSDGPFLSPQNYQRWNAFGKWTAPVGGAELVALASAFDGRWDASGQVPDRAVRSGLISRFGAIDDTEGGSTSRYDASLGLRSRGTGTRAWDARVYATRYDFDLFSNFTFFVNDDVNGDGIEQVDRRTMAGATASYGDRLPLFGREGNWATGASVRGDGGDVELHHQRARVRLEERVNAHAEQRHFSQWLRYELSLSNRLRVDAGVRGDVFRFAVSDRLTGTTSDLPHASGTRWESIVSPRVNLAFDAAEHTRLFANAGTGFHSNDARDVILAGPRDRVLPRATSAELGARHSWNGGTAAAAAWWLDLESETVFIGDEGTTESSGRTRRVGVDVEARQRLLSWLWADADVNLARGRFRDEAAGANYIPLAPSATATAGLTIRDAGAVDGGFRARHIGARPAIEDNSVRAAGYTVWELFAGLQVRGTRLFASIDNLFNVEWNEAQFATTSRLLGESAPVTELHYTPGAPRTFQVGVSQKF